MTFVVSFKKPACGFEFRVIPDAGEHIQNFTIRRCCVSDAIRREKRQAQRFGKTHRRLIASLFNWIAVPLQLEIDILFPEESRQLFNVLSCTVVTLIGKRSRKYAFVAPPSSRRVLLRIRRPLPTLPFLFLFLSRAICSAS
jgi:hypothetical protein